MFRLVLIVLLGLSLAFSDVDHATLLMDSLHAVESQHGLYRKQQRLGNTQAKLWVHDEIDFIDLKKLFRLHYQWQDQSVARLDEEQYRFKQSAPYSLLAAKHIDKSGASQLANKKHIAELTIADFFLPELIFFNRELAKFSAKSLDWQQGYSVEKSYQVNSCSEACSLLLSQSKDNEEHTITIDKYGKVLVAELGSWTLKNESSMQKKVEHGKYDFYQNTLVFTDKPLGDAKTISELTLGFHDEKAVAESQSPRVYKKKASNDQHTITLSVDMKNKLMYLHEQNFWHEADKFMQGYSTKTEKIQAILAWVSDYLYDKPIAANDLNLNDIIQLKQGDCTEHVKLFMAMAEHYNIIAREVSGLVYLGDEQQAFGGHAWVEVYVDGSWQAVDPMWNEFYVSATHIKFGHDHHGLNRLLNLNQSLSFKVLNVKHHPDWL